MAYHEWAAADWVSMIDCTFADQPDYREGANAYARRQASLRLSMRNFCEKSWRHVKEWACLGMNNDDSSLPELHSIATSDEHAVDASICSDEDSIPSLETIAPSSVGHD